MTGNVEFVVYFSGFLESNWDLVGLVEVGKLTPILHWRLRTNRAEKTQRMNNFSMVYEIAIQSNIRSIFQRSQPSWQSSEIVVSECAKLLTGQQRRPQTMVKIYRKICQLSNLEFATLEFAIDLWIMADQNFPHITAISELIQKFGEFPLSPPIIFHSNHAIHNRNSLQWILWESFCFVWNFSNLTSSR